MKLPTYAIQIRPLHMSTHLPAARYPVAVGYHHMLQGKEAALVVACAKTCE
jgi:hypothetical protein